MPEQGFTNRYAHEHETNAKRIKEKEKRFFRKCQGKVSLRLRRRNNRGFRGTRLSKFRSGNYKGIESPFVIRGICVEINTREDYFNLIFVRV